MRFCRTSAVLVAWATLASAALAEGGRVETYDLRPTIRAAFGGGPIGKPLRGPEDVLGRMSAKGAELRLTMAMKELVDPDGWEDMGGRDASAELLKDGRLKVEAPAATHAKVAAFLGALRSPRPIGPAGRAAREPASAPAAGDEPVVVVYSVERLPVRACGIKVVPGKTTREEAAEALVRRVMAEVVTESWVDRGGKLGRIHLISGALAIRQTPDAQRAIETALRRWQGERPARP